MGIIKGRKFWLYQIMEGSVKKALKANPFITVRDPQTGVWMVCKPDTEMAEHSPSHHTRHYSIDSPMPSPNRNHSS